MIIDVHMHIGSYKDIKWEGKWAVTPGDVLRFIESVNIDRAVILPVESFDYRESKNSYMPTDYVLEICNRFPERFISFCNVDPRSEDVRKKIKHYIIDLGCKGFGEHKVKLRIDDERSQRIYGICGKLEVPMLVHMDNNHNMDIKAYERMVKRFSDTVFIAHGPGWWKEISGRVEEVDYPTGKVELGGIADRVLQDYPNAFADISAWSGYNALDRDREFAKGFIKRNYEKLIFGTDVVTMIDEKFNHIELLRSLDLNEAHYNAIVYGNASSLLKL